MKKKYTANDLDALQKEFYRSYPIDHWLYKMSLLRAAHDRYEDIKDVLLEDLKDVSDVDYKTTIRTEIHFLYFQMIEAMFETFFALAKHDNRNLWVALSFSGDRDSGFASKCYRMIEEFKKGTQNLFHPSKTVSYEENGLKKSVPLLQWIFYFHVKTSLSDAQMAQNLKNIETLMKTFAGDFTDRSEYNAYKHSLRLYNAPCTLSIGREGSTTRHMIGKSNDAIYYLEDKEREDGIFSIMKVTKPFDFERDYRCCFVLQELIRNMINTRKYSLLWEELQDQKFDYALFHDIQLPDVTIPKTGLRKSTWTA